MDTPVYYFEPNTVEYEPEDLCIGIALEVQYFDRALTGGKILNGSIDMSLKPNILGGDNNFLTTSYTDITILELEGGGNKESIGIESIDIKYNSWYLPEVNIKFVDVRGNSIFNPMELTNDPNNVDRANGSFLKGFFMFPYPIFKLTVKGYFGKPVTFRLTVKGVPQAQLNAQTGNFEMNVGFIGHMYYYLTDIPMSLLMIAPYINYGGVSGDNGLLISYNNGIRTNTVPTFIDFINGTSDAMVKLSQDSTYSSEAIAKEDQTALLEQIVLLRDLIEKTEQNINDFWEKIKDEPEKDFLTIKILSDDTLLSKGVKKEDVINELCITLKTKIDEICVKLGGKYKTELIYYQNAKINNINDIDANNFVLKANFTADKAMLSEDIARVEENIMTIEKTQQQSVNDVYEKSYGMIPTLKNIFQIILAHLNVLHDIVKACMHDINNESSIRDFSKIKEDTDINTTSKTLTTYPFTGFFKKDKKEHLWIGNTTASNYSEVKLVNAVFKGMNDFNTGMMQAEQDYLLNKKFSVDIPPNGLFSLPEDLISTENEYYKILQTQHKGQLYDYCINDTDNTLPPVLNVFVKRFTKAMLTITDENYLLKDFPKIEAYKMLSCGWDERVYNENTFWGNDSTLSFVNAFKTAVENEINSLEQKLRKSSVKTHVNREDDLSYTSGQFIYHYDDAKYIVRQTDISELNLSQVSLYSEYLGYNEAAQRPGAKNTTMYKKVPLNLMEVTYEKEKYLSSSKEFLDSKNINSNVFYQKDYINSEIKLTKDILEKLIDAIKNDKTTSEIIAIFPKDIVVLSSIIPIMNKGGCIRLKKFAYIIGYNTYKDIEVFNGRPSGYGGTFFDNHTTELPIKIFFTRNKKIYDDNVDVFIEKFREIVLKYKFLYSDEFKNEIEKVISEDIDVICSYYFKDGVFPFSIGQDAENNFFSEDKVSSYQINKNNLSKYYDNRDNNPLVTFIETVRQHIQPQLKEKEVVEYDYKKEIAEIKATTEKKIAIYDIFKNLYDRWKFGTEDFNSIYNKNINSIGIENFIFRDALNRDISETLEVNIDKFIGMLFSIYKGERDMSLYEFLFETCKDINTLLIALPSNSFGAMKSSNGMKEMFTPIPYSSVINNPTSATFVVTYRQKDSQHLNYHPNESAYKDDGIDFMNYISLNNDGDNQGLGVFGVTYGMGKQSYFKNIISSMDKPRVTEQSIASTLSIAEQGAKNSSQNYGMSSHDVFDTYSQHSYHCSVETMGNMQIMPMMYFQLNNIPLFKGGYFITSVEHSINKDGMKTTFKGNRLSQNQIQLLRSGKFKINVDNSYNRSNTGSESVSDTNTRSYPALTYTKENTLIVVYAGRAMSDPYYESPDLVEDSEFKDINGNTEEEEYILTPHDSNNKPVTKKYREYWGNRKIAMSLVYKLQEAGYEVQTAFYDELSAQEKKFSTSYIQRWGGVERNTIAVCIYSDEITNIDGNGNVIAPNWGTNKQWVIYKQNKDGEYDPATRQFIQKPYHLVSEKLAQCIASKMSTALSGDANIVVNTTPQINKSQVAWKGITDLEMPSVLSKNLFHTTKAHVKFLASKTNREKIAQAHFDGIEQFFKDMEGKNSRMLITNGDEVMLSTNGDEVMLSTYFSYSELTRTNQIDPETGKKMINIPNEAEKQNLITLATTILDKVREKYGKAIWVESGFRCEKVNKAVKGKAGSQHKTGSAADLYALDRINNAPIFWAAYDLIQSGEITVGQLIWEYGTNKQPGWVHISLPNRVSGKTNEFLRYYIGADGKEHSKPFKVDEYVRVDE